MSGSIAEREIFTIGSSGELNGIEWRVVSGTKAPGDLVLELNTPRGWRKFPMSLSALAADFFAQNEPRVRKGYRAEKHMEHLRLASRKGWRYATAILETEKTLRLIPPPTQDAERGREEWLTP